jgi:hypothetical protein
MTGDQQLEHIIDRLLATVGRIAVLREHRSTLAPFKGSYGRPDPDGDAVDRIEKFLIAKARSLARTIAAAIE